MKLSKPVESSMAIVVDYMPEIRFTSYGKRLATWRAKDMRNLYFQQWEPETPRVLTPYEKDTGEYEGTVDKLLELPVNAALIVVGHCATQDLRTPHGDKVKVNYFTVRDWAYASWPWKIRNQRMGATNDAVSILPTPRRVS